MDLTDANVLVYAHRQDSPHHDSNRKWLEEMINSDEAYGVSDHVLAGFLRIVTHPSIFNPPSSLEEALSFANQLRDQPNAVSIRSGSRHWGIFTQLCRDSNARGNLVPDAFLAALAIESGSEWVTTNRDYEQFSGLRWRHPIQN